MLGGGTEGDGAERGVEEGNGGYGEGKGVSGTRPTYKYLTAFEDGMVLCVNCTTSRFVCCKLDVRCALELVGCTVLQHCYGQNGTAVDKVLMELFRSGRDTVVPLREVSHKHGATVSILGETVGVGRLHLPWRRKADRRPS